MAAKSHEARMEMLNCSLKNDGQKEANPSSVNKDLSPSDGAEGPAGADALLRARFWVGRRMDGTCCLFFFGLPRTGISARSMQM